MVLPQMKRNALEQQNPANGTLPVSVPLPTPSSIQNNSQGRSISRPIHPTHRDGFPPQQEINLLIKCIVWGLTAAIFGGGLIAWFVMCGFFEREFKSLTGTSDWVQGQSEAMEGLSGSSLAVAEEEDLAFISQQLGILDDSIGTFSGSQVPETVNRRGRARFHPADSVSLEETENWPNLSVNGIMRGNDNHGGSVILNGVVVQVGREFQGVKVLDVKKGAAVLGYQGKTVWLISGQSTGRP